MPHGERLPDHSRTRDLPPELWAYLKEHRFFAMIIRKEYGGLEFSAYAQARVLQNSPAFPDPGNHRWRAYSLGPGELLQHYGTEEQKIITCRVWLAVRRSRALL
ncbi:acyl-CoA dehydrogenase family protein [Shigella flexneri]